MKLKTIEATVIITNGSFFFMWPELEDLCYSNDIEPTKRQASKFRNKKGRLWKVYNANNIAKIIH